MTANKVAQELIYRCYRFQRTNKPEIEPERWGTLPGFEKWAEMEERFKEEIRHELQTIGR